jgi:hypothetical protein
MLIALSFLTGCATTPSDTTGQPIPERGDRSSASQLVKSDFDRMADVELEETLQSLRLLMLKLYKRNPLELQKSTTDRAEKMVDWVFEGENQHHFLFDAISKKQGTEAVNLTFKADYTGDRVLPFIVGLHTMILKAHGDKKTFYITDKIDPQRLYNAARNVEIAAWKLSNARKPNGDLFLLTNTLNQQDRNLSFEREFGKIIGRTDLFAMTLAEKSQRLISRVMQSLATAAFLPF